MSQAWQSLEEGEGEGTKDREAWIARGEGRAYHSRSSSGVVGRRRRLGKGKGERRKEGGREIKRERCSMLLRRVCM